MKSSEDMKILLVQLILDCKTKLQTSVNGQVTEKV